MIFKRLWRDESAIINTTDIILMTTILGLGIIVGVVMLRNQVVQEFGDLSVAIGNLNQSYEYADHTVTFGTTSYTANGSEYDDLLDPGDGDDVAGQPPAGISITSPGPTLKNTTPGEK